MSPRLRPAYAVACATGRPARPRAGSTASPASPRRAVRGEHALHRVHVCRLTAAGACTSQRARPAYPLRV